MKRDRFNRNAVASSRGAYVYHSHIAYIKEQHEKNRQVIAELNITVKVKPKYFVKCFGKIRQITEREAMMLGPQIVITL